MRYVIFIKQLNTNPLWSETCFSAKHLLNNCDSNKQMYLELKKQAYKLLWTEEHYSRFWNGKINSKIYSIWKMHKPKRK